jgi:preprotein translocase subunit Sec63
LGGAFLRALLRAVEVATEPARAGVPDFDGMSIREVFGLSSSITRRDLDRARRRLVQELHPDRWQQASPSERRLREEALKRVNAAYDSLRREVP